MPIKPRRLTEGDTLGIIAPASAPPDPKAIDYAIAVIETLGFKVKLARHARKRWGFLAGTDRERAADLMSMFADAKVRGILCVRGGYGTARILSLLDYKLIRNNPKVFVGYSDITSLHFAFLKKANLITFHGPMLNSDFVREKFPRFTLESFRRTLMEPVAAGGILKGYKGRTISTIQKGRATGQLIGGNLSLICTTLGTPYQLPFRNRILFLEDLDEPPYRFDRMLTHLLNAGLLQQVTGIAVGINANFTDPRASKAKEFRQTLEDVLAERLRSLRVPIVCGLPFGHVPFNATLPVGAKATVDANRGDLVIEESAVH